MSVPLRPWVQAPAPLSEVVAAALREMITTAQYAPGEHLKETEIAAALNVSRGPVREALSQLEAEGHVELRRHRGAFVSTLTKHDVEEVHTLRLAIERLAAERACTRMDRAAFAAMDAVLEKMRAAPPDIEAADAVSLDLQFHDIVYAACEHQRVQRVWRSIRSQVSFFLHTRNINFPDFVLVGHAEHIALRTALALGDPAVARDAVEEHLSGAYQRLMKLPLPEDPVDADRREPREAS